MLIPRSLVVGALGALALGTVATSANAGYAGYGGYGDGIRAVSYLNGDGGNNADVDPNSSCSRPDQYDMQAFSSAASGNPGDRNVDNDACFLDGNGDKVGKGVGASFVASGTGYISACPDPDGAGPEFALLRDLNGDGRNDSCYQSSYQEKGTAGDFEYHVGSTTPAPAASSRSRGASSSTGTAGSTAATTTASRSAGPATARAAAIATGGDRRAGPGAPARSPARPQQPTQPATPLSGGTMKIRRTIVVATLAGMGILVPASGALAAHPQPTTKDDCKKGEFAEYKTSGMPGAVQRFDNQGQCVRFVQTGKG